MRSRITARRNRQRQPAQLSKGWRLVKPALDVQARRWVSSRTRCLILLGKVPPKIERLDVSNRLMGATNLRR